MENLQNINRLQVISGLLGLSAIGVFITALVVFGSLNTEFSLFNDFVSKLGAKGEPNSIWWNLIRFVLVGLLLVAFGAMYGIILKDRLLGIFLSIFGVGFALTSIPMDIVEPDSPVSKAHIVVICLALAFWLFGLSRMGYKPQLDKKIRIRANFTAMILVASMVGYVLGFWSMPITHRLVFGVVFAWTGITSLELLTKNPVNRIEH